MTRGRLPVRARKEADPVAEKRGKVQHYQYEPGAIFSFTIFGRTSDAHVAMKCVRRLGCTVQELERELCDLLAAIRLTVSCPGISRELWLCSPRYAMRFFRVLDAGLVELDREGMGLGNGAGSAGAEIPGNAALLMVIKTRRDRNASFRYTGEDGSRVNPLIHSPPDAVL